MAVLKVINQFTNTFKGTMIAKRGTVAIGSEEGTVAPYDMLFGALASCMYSTFLDIMEKKKVPFEAVDVEISGEKRTTIPMTLEWVTVKFVVKGAPEDKHKAFQQALDLAAKYCSIYQTIAHVAEMKTEIEFS